MRTNEIEHCRRVAGIRVAIEKAGGQKALAKQIGVSQQAVSLWATRGWAPEKHVPAIRQVTGVPARVLMRPETVELATESND